MESPTPRNPKVFGLFWPLPILAQAIVLPLSAFILFIHRWLQAFLAPFKIRIPLSTLRYNTPLYYCGIFLDFFGLAPLPLAVSLRPPRVTVLASSLSLRCPKYSRSPTCCSTLPSGLGNYLWLSCTIYQQSFPYTPFAAFCHPRPVINLRH